MIGCASKALLACSGMAIGWSDEQRERVVHILVEYPVASGRCETVAWSILPIAKERDVAAEVWELRPSEGRYIVPKMEPPKPWFHHLTVEVEAHCVDALTGSSGEPRSAYLENHWTDIEAIAWVLKQERPHEPW